MAGKKLETIRSARAWELARAQHGVVSRRNLLALGFTSSAIEHRLRTGRLRPLTQGVYAVGWSRPDRKQEWMAAVLACGETACLSHRSAATLWQITRAAPGPIDVTVRRHTDLRRRGLRIRMRSALPCADVTVFDGIPVTVPAWTLLDLATELNAKALERAVNEADKRDRIDPEALRARIGAYVGRPGVARLRTLLDRLTFRLSDTELEVLFRPIAVQAGLPTPRTKEMVNGFEVDFHWPELGLVVETDGWRYHRTPSAQTRDAVRDQTHTASGLTTLRFSHYQVAHEPRHVRQILERTAAHLRR